MGTTPGGHSLPSPATFPTYTTSSYASTSRRIFLAIGFFTVLQLLLFAYNSINDSKARQQAGNIIISSQRPDILEQQAAAQWKHYEAMQKPTYTGGIPDPNHDYEKAVVVASMAADNTSWIAEKLPGISAFVYIVNNQSAPLHTPMNKGHEAMPYLTYLIENYDNLPDISIFLHSHQISYHTPWILGTDAVQTVKALSAPRVIREGYVNLRCRNKPGCPAHIRPMSEPEHEEFAAAWLELFPEDPIPETLAGACCAQFAVSRERIQQIPKEKFIHLRKWIYKTELDGDKAGWIWEFMWHYLFTGNEVHCPAEHVCYCDLYGFCFGGEEGYQPFYEMQEELWALQDSCGQQEALQREGKPTKGADWMKKSRARITELGGEMRKMAAEAKIRGNDPRQRAFEAGRQWREGDRY